MYSTKKVQAMVDNCAFVSYVKDWQGDTTGFILSYENLQEILTWAYNEGVENAQVEEEHHG